MRESVKLKIFIFLLFVLSCLGRAQADTIYFKDSRPNLEGIIKTEGKDFIEVEISGGVVKFRKDEVAWTVKSMDSIRMGIRQKWEQEKADAESVLGRTQDSRPGQAEFIRGQQGIIVNTVINGKVRARLIFDTGSSLVVLRKGLVKELGIDFVDTNPDMKVILADGRQTAAKHIVLHSVRVENSLVENVDAAILVDEVQQDLLADGLLGMSFLKHFDFRIDQKANKLILEKAQQ